MHDYTLKTIFTQFRNNTVQEKDAIIFYIVFFLLKYDFKILNKKYYYATIVWLERDR